MDELTKAAVEEIEQIHSTWIALEVAGENHRLIPLCAEEIELWPPDAQPLRGRASVLAQMTRGNATVQDIEITDRHIRGSNEIAYLTANYKTTFHTTDDLTSRQALGSHLWILRKHAGTWLVALISWSSWMV